MSVHDWSRVTDNVFHDFHNAWISAIRNALNKGVLPPGYIARGEQKFGTPIADVLTLFLPDQPAVETNGHHSPQREAGGLALAVAPPRVKSAVVEPPIGFRNRSVVVRDAGTERPVAIIEVVSRSNKDGPVKLADFVDKVNATVEAGVHVVLLDLLPPNGHTPGGLHAALSADRGRPIEPPNPEWQPAAQPVALLSYLADRQLSRVFYEYVAVGGPLPELPLFLSTERYVNLPLAETYAETFAGTDFVTRRRLEG